MKTFLTYFIIGVLVGYYMYTKLLPSFKRRKTFFPVFINEQSTLTPIQYKKVALGAIYSEMTHAYINTLRTGLDKHYIISRLLAGYWKLHNAMEVREKLEYLRDKGFRYYLPGVYKALRANTTAGQELILTEHFTEEEELGKAYTQLHNLIETLQELQEDDILETEQDILKYGMIGWDCGRLVFLARLSYDAGYIREAEAWGFINAAEELARITYEDWESYAKSYVLGRAMWGGISSGNRDVAAIAGYLLERVDSPWIVMPWKTG